MSDFLAFLRNTWRGLTSMRTALILLFLLAVGSLPAALLPQWYLNQTKTAQYITAHPGEVCPAKWDEGADTLTPSLDLVGKL